MPGRGSLVEARLVGACSVENGRQGVREGVEVGGSDHERRDEAQSRRPGRVEDEAGVAARRDGLGGVVAVQLGTAHQAEPGDLPHVGLGSQQGGQLLAAFAGGRQEVRVREHVEDGQRGGTRHRVAAEGRAVVARTEEGRRVTAGDRRADRDAAAQTLGQGDDVRDHSPGEGLLVGEPGAGATDAGLHLVEPQQRAVPGGDLAGCREVAVRWDDDPGLALDGFEDDGGTGVVDGGGERLDVAVGDEGDVTRQRLEGLAVGRLRRQGQRAHGATVEGALGRDQPGPAGAAGELQGRLVGLGAGVAEEDPPVCPLEESQEPLGEPHLRLGGEEVGDVPERRQLGRDGLDDRRVRVAERVDRDAAEQVDVLLAVGVPHPGTHTTRERQCRRTEGVHHGRCVAVLDGGCGAHDCSWVG